MRAVVGLATLAVLTVAGRAHATPSARLVYARSTEAASCPDEPALRKAVAARFGYDPFFAWARQTVVVQISRDARGYLARVQLVDEQGLARGTREITSQEEQCSELFDAAALAISIALDASTQAPAAPTSAATPEIVPASAPVESPPPSPPLPPARAEIGAPEAPSAPPRGPGPGPFRLGIDALVAAGVGLNPEPGLDVFGDVRSGPLSLGLELQADMGLRSRVSLAAYPGATAHVASSLLSAALAPCAHFGPWFACVLGEIGWLQAEGSGLTDSRSDSAVFVGLGGRAGVEWALSPAFFLRVRGDLVADLTPSTFYVDGQNVGAALPVAGTLGAGVGAHLP